MATIRKEFRSPQSADQVWARLKDFGAVHELAKGFVTHTRLEADGRARVVTFINGVEIREWLVSADEAERRLVYAITDSPRFEHYSAAAQVVEEEGGSRFVWTVDFLPDEAAPMQDAAMAAGAEAMRRSLAG
ncbi:MAG: SRPBCC family protein [Pseudomonadota bacterium]